MAPLAPVMATRIFKQLHHGIHPHFPQGANAVGHTSTTISKFKFHYSPFSLHYSPMSESLTINEIYLSLQGESTFAGLPCVFIRLTACNLRCSYCDTAYAFTE